MRRFVPPSIAGLMLGTASPAPATSFGALDGATHATLGSTLSVVPVQHIVPS